MFLTNLYLLVEAGSFVVCVLLYKTLKSSNLKYFLPFLLLTIVIELVGNWLMGKGIRNYLMFNLFTSI
ncbi:hypothetical protein ABTE41_19035, partial [Acinetobacter baumannii]